MNQRTVLGLSIALTAFLAITVGSVINTVRAAQEKSAAAAQAAQATQGISPEVLKQLADREAQYQALVAQANSQLAQAQKDNQALQAELSALKNPTAQPTSATLTPQQASQVAANYLHRTDLYAVESAALNGATVYKITFSSGDVVYVSQAGQVVGVQPAPSISTSTGSSGGGGHYDDGGEHEGDH